MTTTVIKNETWQSSSVNICRILTPTENLKEKKHPKNVAFFEISFVHLAQLKEIKTALRVPVNMRGALIADDTTLLFTHILSDGMLWLITIAPQKRLPRQHVGIHDSCSLSSILCDNAISQIEAKMHIKVIATLAWSC